MMRIHLPLHPRHFAAQTAAGTLAVIGGDLVVVELQGELEWEGDRADGVVGVLGFDRPDHPTLHIGEHHLLHGKMATLPKPYAVIRKAQAPGTSGSNQGDAHVLEGDAADEESDEEREKEEEEDAAAAQGSAKKRRAEEDEDGPLFPDVQVTPVKNKKRRPSDLLSSPWSEPPTPRDYSSDLSSPPGDFWGTSEFGGDDDDEEDEDEGRAKEREEREKARERERRRKERRERRRAEAQAGRTRYYEVVAVVRKKVVFALRPEPLVKATQLPE